MTESFRGLWDPGWNVVLGSSNVVSRSRSIGDAWMWDDTRNILCKPSRRLRGAATNTRFHGIRGIQVVIPARNSLLEPQFPPSTIFQLNTLQLPITLCAGRRSSFVVVTWALIPYWTRLCVWMTGSSATSQAWLGVTRVVVRKSHDPLRVIRDVMLSASDSAYGQRGTTKHLQDPARTFQPVLESRCYPASFSYASSAGRNVLTSSGRCCVGFDPNHEEQRGAIAAKNYV